MANTIQEEIDVLVRQLYKVADKGKQESQRAFKRAAPILISAIKSRAPVSTAAHYRMKGGTKIVYQPGNLKRSFRALTFRGSAAVFVGPKTQKGPQTPDGYYGPWVEFGTINQSAQPFVRPAAAAAGGATLKLAVTELKKAIDKYANSIAI